MKAVITGVQAGSRVGRVERALSCTALGVIRAIEKLFQVLFKACYLRIHPNCIPLYQLNDCV